MIGAFFDLDGTLLSVNSGKLWMSAERREGRLDTLQMVTAALFFTAYRAGVIDMSKAMRRALSTIEGLSEETIRERTVAWYEREVRQHAAPGGWPAIAEHREQGHRLVLLTSSSPYEAGAAREQFELDDAISMRYEVRGGRFTGEVERPMCYGEGKVDLAERYAAERGVDLDRSYFYSDSITDFPMLARVGNPVAVDPDPRLRVAAWRRRWPVANWAG